MQFSKLLFFCLALVAVTLSTQVFASKPVPYLDAVPLLKSVLQPYLPSTWEGGCFKKTTATLAVTPIDGLITLHVSEPTSLFCSDSYLIATRESYYVTTIFFSGTHTIKIGAPFKKDEVKDIQVNDTMSF